MFRLRACGAFALLLVLTGPVFLEATGRAETCSMCASRCCCKPPEGSGMSGACRLSRPCAAGEQKSVTPTMAANPAVLDRARGWSAAMADATALVAALSSGPSGRTAAPAVPPPRG